MPTVSALSIVRESVLVVALGRSMSELVKPGVHIRTPSSRRALHCNKRHRQRNFL